ncbi:hypothetical protein TSOC_008496, partial [Tetrabaena socialis]
MAGYDEEGEYEDDDFDQIEYRPPQPKPAFVAAQVDPYAAGGGLPGNKRREPDDRHHVDVTPGAGQGPDLGPGTDQGLAAGGAYPHAGNADLQPAAKRAAGGAAGSQRAFPAPYGGGAPAYDTYSTSNGGGGVPGGGAYGSGEYGTAPAAGGSQGNGVSADAAGGVAAPLCQCNEACIRRVSNTGKNPGRGFFKCPKPQGEQCRYFKWEDELGAAAGGTQTASNVGAYGAGAGAYDGGGGGAYGGGAYGGPPAAAVNPYVANPYGVGGGATPPAANPYGGPAAYDAGGAAGGGGGTWGSGGGADPAAAPPGAGPEGGGTEEYVKCMCGVDCPVKTSNSAANPGRQFWACPKMRDDPTRCRYFQWTDEAGPGGGVGSGPGGGAGAGAYGGGGGGGGAAGGTCYQCGQPGHFASACPQRVAGGGAGAGGGGFGGRGGFGGGGGGGGGGAAGGQPCFLCQQP